MTDMICHLCHRRPVDGGSPLLDPRTFKDVPVCGRCRTIGACASHDPAASSRLDHMDDMDWYIWFDALAARMYQRTAEYKQRQRAHIEERVQRERAATSANTADAAFEQQSSINEHGLVVEHYGTMTSEQPAKKLKLID